MRANMLEGMETKPWTTRPGVRCQGMPACARALDVLDVAWMAAINSSGALTDSELEQLRCDFLDFPVTVVS